jgi:hypothetical protein
MLSFRHFLIEAEGYGLTIFDIDETLFHTKARIYVVRDGVITKKLDNQQFNTYKLKSGESFDFGEFGDAQFFYDTSKPIEKVVKKMKAITKNAVAKGSSVIIVTARADFDNKKIFLNTFRKYGIDIDNIYVERAGNLNYGTPAKNKRSIFKKYLDTGNFVRIRLFDDSNENIEEFLSLQSKYSNVKFEAFFVNEFGDSIRKR